MFKNILHENRYKRLYTILRNLQFLHWMENINDQMDSV